MSRIGKKPVSIPSGVEVKIDNQTVSVKGKLGTLTRAFHNGVEITREGDTLAVVARGSGRESNALWGLSRALLNNMVVGVSDGFSKTMEIIGVGYRAQVAGRTLKLSLGFSHDVDYPLPDGIEVAVDKNTVVTVKGADKELVGKVCAELREYRTPEPYKGKGVRYSGEYVALKVGKKKK